MLKCITLFCVVSITSNVQLMPSHLFPWMYHHKYTQVIRNSFSVIYILLYYIENGANVFISALVGAFTVFSRPSCLILCKRAKSPAGTITVSEGGWNFGPNPNSLLGSGWMVRGTRWVEWGGADALELLSVVVVLVDVNSGIPSVGVLVVKGAPEDMTVLKSQERPPVCWPVRNKIWTINTSFQMKIYTKMYIYKLQGLHWMHR